MLLHDQAVIIIIIMIIIIIIIIMEVHQQRLVGKELHFSFLLRGL